MARELLNARTAKGKGQYSTAGLAVLQATDTGASLALNVKDAGQHGAESAMGEENTRMIGIEAFVLIKAIQDVEDSKNRFGKKGKYWRNLKQLDAMARKIGARVIVKHDFIYLMPNK